MWKLDRKNNGLFQRLFCDLQTGNIVPLHIWFVHDDGVGQTGTKFLDLRVMIVIVTASIQAQNSVEW